MDTLFTSVQKSQLLSKTVEQSIQKAIATRQLEPGDRLPTELELCDQFGVSRTVMREALRMLSARGLISIEKGRGMFVSQLTVDSVTAPFALYLHMNHDAENKLHVIGARQMVEPAIAEEAARRHKSEDDDKLRRNYDLLVGMDEDVSQLSTVDMSFHMLIAGATHNPLIPLLMEPIHQMMPQIKASVYQVVKDAHESAVEWHGHILEAILASDPAGARKAMEDHLDIARDHILRIAASEKANSVDAN